MALGEGGSVGRRDQMIAKTIQNLLEHPEKLTEYEIGFFGDSELETVLPHLRPCQTDTPSSMS